MKTFSKKDVVKYISETTRTPIKKVNEIMQAANSIITKKVFDGDKVNCLGLGSFKKVSHKEKVFKNPKTKQTSILKGKKYVKFSSSKTFSEILNK